MSSVPQKSIFNRPLPAQNSKPTKLFPLPKKETKSDSTELPTPNTKQISQLPQNSEGPHPFKLPHTDPLKPLTIKDQYHLITNQLSSLDRNIHDVKSSLLTYNTIFYAATLALDHKILERVDILTAIVQRLMSLTINSIPTSDTNNSQIQELQTLNAKLQMDNDSLSSQLQHATSLLSQLQSQNPIPDQLDYHPSPPTHSTSVQSKSPTSTQSAPDSQSLPVTQSPSAPQSSPAPQSLPDLTSNVSSQSVNREPKADDSPTASGEGPRLVGGKLSVVQDKINLIDF